MSLDSGARLACTGASARSTCSSAAATRRCEEGAWSRSTSCAANSSAVTSLSDCVLRCEHEVLRRRRFWELDLHGEDAPNRRYGFCKLKSAAAWQRLRLDRAPRKQSIPSCRRCSAIGAPLRSSRHRRRRALPSQIAFSPSDSVPHCCRRLCRSHNLLPKARTAI